MLQDFKKHLMTGISYMIPMVVAGGILGGKKSRFYLIFPFRLKSRIILYLWAFFELVNTFFFPNFPLNISYFLRSN